MSEVLIIPAVMFPNDPAKRAEYEQAARNRAKRNPGTLSITEQVRFMRAQVEQEIDRACSASPPARGKG